MIEILHNNVSSPIKIVNSSRKWSTSSLHFPNSHNQSTNIIHYWFSKCLNKKPKWYETRRFISQPSAFKRNNFYCFLAYLWWKAFILRKPWSRDDGSIANVTRSQFSRPTANPTNENKECCALNKSRLQHNEVETWTMKKPGNLHILIITNS